MPSSAPSRRQEDELITGWEEKGPRQQAAPAALLIYMAGRGGGVGVNHPRDGEYTAEDVSLNLNAAVYQMALIPSQVWLIQQRGHSYPEYIQIKPAGCSTQGGTNNTEMSDLFLRLHRKHRALTQINKQAEILFSGGERCELDHRRAHHIQPTCKDTADAY